jgi:amidohydrolase
MDVDNLNTNTLKSDFSKYKKELLELNKYMYKNPELGYQEVKSVDKITKLIQKFVTDAKFKKFNEIPTAFSASFNKRTSKKDIAICIEYDALPNIGHACGHNLISSIGLGAFFILSNYKKELDYEIKLVGCPAEEIIPLTYENGGGGGKIKLIDQGVFDNTAYSVMIHPATRNEVDPLMIAVKQIDIEYFGKAAHASGSAYVGKNALDAQILAYNNISALRQQLQPVEKVHGIITHGGESPNIIPDYTRSSWMIRAQKTKDLNRLEKKIINCFKGAAESTGCKLNIVEGNGTYENLVTDEKLRLIFMENSKKLSLDMKTNESYDQSKNGSTDFGNISKLVPSLHAFLQIVDDDGKIVNHQPEFAHATITKRATDMIETGSVLLASTILDL